MAAMAPARPVSQILPHQYDVFFESPTAIEQRFQPPPSPPTRVRTSHYRPFSTLYTESPYIDIQEDKTTARRLKRSSSIGGLHAFSNMGINFTGKAKKESPRLSPIASEFGVLKGSTPIKSKSLKVPEPPRPSTSTGISRPLPLFRMKKKRSMASLFTSSPEAAAVAGNSPEAAQSPLNNRSHVVTPSPGSDSSVLTIKSSNKGLSFKEPAVDDYASASFIPRAIWAKRHNMTLHPYKREVPYMQAYDPILLESDRYTDVLLQHLTQGSPSFHDFGKKTPATALDLGCGQGHWVLHAAGIWKTCQITAFDLVNITQQALEVTENAQFIQGNFLNSKLPFDDKSFEFIRMANLNLCIPREDWPTVLEEVYRVLAPGGRLEIVDDQMYFPYGDGPKSKSPRKNSSVSSFEDSDDDDLFEDSTLQDDDSVETDSTLVSDEGCRLSSFDDKECHLSESVTVRPLPGVSAFLPPTPDFAAPKIPAVLRGSQRLPPLTHGLKESRYLAWRRQSLTCHQLEQAFEIMLAKRYRMSVRPSAFLTDLLEGLFGKNMGGQVRSFQLKLAPADSPIGPAAMKAKADAAKNSESEERKPWNKKRDGKEKRGDGPNVDGLSSGTSSKRSSIEAQPLMSTPLPASMNAKAAARLGLPHAMNAKAAGRLGYDLSPATTTSPKDKDTYKKSSEKERTLNSKSSSLSSKSLMPPPAVPIAINQPLMLSAKAAGRLGIAHSPLSYGKVASVGNLRAEAQKTAKPVQSPGLLVWPSMYIAMSPTELEMHACKYMHTLLGCRSAIADWMHKHIDEQGKPLIDEREFEEVIWDYECFRRSRFNWPSDNDWSEDDSTTTAPPPTEPVYVKSSKSASFMSRDNLDSFNGQYLRDELTHVRTIRVFSAVKHAEDTSFLSMLKSKSFSHSPKP